MLPAASSLHHACADRSTSPSAATSTSTSTSTAAAPTEQAHHESQISTRAEIHAAPYPAPVHIEELRSSLIGNLPLPLDAAGHISGNDALVILESSSSGMNALISDLRDHLTVAETDLCDCIERFNEEFYPDEISTVDSNKTRIENLLAQHCSTYAQNENRTLTVCERGCATLDFLSTALYRITQNDFDHPIGRWAANIANVSIRTGLIVGLLTTARQLIGFAIEKACLLGDRPFLNREAIGAVSMCIGPALNLVGCIRDEINHCATVESRTARATMAALSIGALMTTYIIQTETRGSVLNDMMRSAGPQIATYALARDLAYAFFPKIDNAPINFKGSAISAFIYGSSQYAVGQAMDTYAPHSGPAYARQLAETAQANIDPETSTPNDRDIMQAFEWMRSNPGIVTRSQRQESSSTTVSTSTEQDEIARRIQEAISNIHPAMGHDIIRGLLNLFPEVSDEFLLPTLSRHFAVNATLERTRNEARAAGMDPDVAVAQLPAASTEGLRISLDLRIPSRTQLADQFLTTSAMRTSAFETMIGGALAVASTLGSTLLSAEDQGKITNAVIAALSAVVYIPMAHAHARRPVGETGSISTITSASSSHTEEATSSSGLRRRLLTKDVDAAALTLTELEEHRTDPHSHI